MKKYTPIFFLFFAGWLNLALAQSPVFKSFTIQDGLVGNPAKRIFQDSKGFIWICTWDGLSKYDGHRFTNFSRANGLSHDLVNDICESPDGKLYVSLNNGITHIITNDRILSNIVLKDTNISRFAHADNEGTLAITDQQGVMKFTSGKLQPLSPSLPLPEGSILRVADSLFLVSSPDFFKLYLLNSKFEIIAGYSGSVSVNSLFRDSRNRIWAGCSDGLKQILVNPKDRIIDLFVPPSPFRHSFLLKERIQCIWEDHQRGLWIGTRTGLVLIEESGAIQKFTKTEGLPDEHVYCLFEDRERNIWVGTGLGVARLANQGRRKYWSAGTGLLDDYVFSVIKTGNRYLLSGNGGIQEIIPGNNQFTTLKIPFKKRHALHYAQSSTFAFVYTNNYTSHGSIARFDLKNYTIKDNSEYILPSGMNFLCLTSSKKGTFVIGTTYGMAALHDGIVKIDTTIKASITFLLIDDSVLWAGTHNKGLYSIRLKENENVELSGHTRILDLPDSMIRSIYKDSRGILWIGTRLNGVYKMVENKNGSYDVEKFDKGRGLVSNWVRYITEDKDHNIWIGSNAGVDKLLEKERVWRVFNFSRFNNLFGVVNSILPEDNGSMWIGMNNGLARIQQAGFDTLPPMPVYITNIRTHLKIDSSFIPAEHSSLSLPYIKNSISFDFTSTAFINEKEMKYSFRLVSDNDTTWSNPSSQQTVFYASLQPGSYRFEVKNRGWNGAWGNPTTYPFTVRPPFWKAWWFIVLLVCLISFILYLLYRYRIGQLRRVQLVRNRIATDLHDDIGSALTNISILTELSKRNRQDPEKAQAYIDRIREEIDASGQALDDIIWSVNIKNDTLHETAARMRRYASELFDAGNIRYDLAMDPQIADKKIGMEQRRDLFLIYKEALNNIHKHAAATAVSISLFIRNETLKLVIIDNGRGFDISQPTQRNGIGNIKNRVGRWKGVVNIRSENGKGTTINIQLPLSGTTQKGE